jgi:hypothetical protein
MSNVKKSFDKVTVGLFRNDFQKAVKELEDKYGVHISLGTLTYSESEVRGKMTATKGEKPVRASISEFRFGDVVKVNHKKVSSSKSFKVIKINRKTILVENIDNKFDRFKVSAGLLVKA